MIKSILPLYIGQDVTPDFLSEHLYASFKQVLPDLQIGFGTDQDFAELNRNRPSGENHDFVCFSLNPQVHAWDTRTLLKNLRTLPDIITTVKSFTDKPIYISPLTIQRRAEKTSSGFLKEDPADRAHTHFAIGWYLLALYYLQGAEQVLLHFLPRELIDQRPRSIPVEEKRNTVRIHEIPPVGGDANGKAQLARRRPCWLM